MTSSSSTTSLRTKFPRAREAIEARSAHPPLSAPNITDLIPVEMRFSKPKARLRKFAERTVLRLYRRIGSFARSLAAQEGPQLFQARRLCVKSTGSNIAHSGRENSFATHSPEKQACLSNFVVW
jgi:hypothetical protein